MTRLTIATVLSALMVAAGSSSAAAVERCPRVEIDLVRPKPSPETRPVGWSGRTIHVDRTPLITTADITGARWGEPDEMTGDVPLWLTFKAEPGARLERATANPAGVQIAFVVDDQALLNVFFSGGYGVGTEGLQVSLSYPKAAKGLPESIARCSSKIAGD